MRVRRHKSANCLAGLYLAWGLLVFFGSLGTEGHDWWPLSLYFIIWPLGAIFEVVSTALFERIFPSQATAPSWAWTAYDYLGGFFYIGIGTIWVWFLARVATGSISHIYRRIRSQPRTLRA